MPILIRHPASARGNDLYETPEVATLSLLAVEPLPPTILEPACGRGAIARCCAAPVTRSLRTTSSTTAGPGQREGFSEFKPAWADEIDAVVTNPPYRLAQHFVQHALTLCPRVFMLLRLTFYESERRKDVLDGAGLIRVHVFRNRLPMMHRDGWAGNRASNPVAFAWYVWERGYTGKPEIDRISWNRGAS